MRIGFDARFLTHPQAGGFKTYTESLAAALAGAEGGHEYVFYVDRPPDSRMRVPDAPNVTLRVVPGALPVLGMLWREQVALGRQAARDGIELLHAPCLTAPMRLSCPLVVTMHDMLWRHPRRLPAAGPRPFRQALISAYYRVVPAWAAKRASVILTVSQWARQTLVQQLGLDQDRVAVTYEAAAGRFRQLGASPAAQAVRRAYGLPGDYILALGSADPRKNMPALVRAFATLPADLRTKTSLAIVCTHPSLEPRLAGLVDSLNLASRVRFLQHVSADTLVALYNEAALFVLPSLQEGFGLPLLEAMACGTPIVAADNSAIPEIAGDAALLVDPMDAEAMAGRMRQVLTDAPLRAALVHAGLRRAATFSWERCARETVDAYARALSQRP